jgi:predicted nucleotidyltransferase component of viral defense system
VTSARDGLARSVQVRLARHAREIGVDPNLVLARYGVERFLFRLSRSRYSDQFVLKGALLMLAWLGESLRPTRDADLLGLVELSDDNLMAMFRELCELEVEPDAMSFSSDTIRVAPIREEDVHGGRRVTLDGTLGVARIPIQLDIGIGDVITPPPEQLEYPSMLNLSRPRLWVYPRETVIAEKFHAMVVLGIRNSRMKDYFDVYALLRENALEMNDLSRAIAATFLRRRTPLPESVPLGISDEFSSDVTNSARWAGFLVKNRLAAPPLDGIVKEIREFLSGPLAKARQQGKV